MYSPKKTTTSELRKLVFRPEKMDQQFNRSEHFDKDWIRNTIYNLYVLIFRLNQKQELESNYMLYFTG